MPILTKTIEWQKPRTPKPHGTGDLTPEEHANVKTALAVLHRRHGGWEDVAKALGTTKKRVETIMGPRKKPTAGLALRVARLAGVPMEDVLSGAWPKPGACPMCGRVT